jgi:cyanophycin synthetase
MFSLCFAGRAAVSGVAEAAISWRVVGASLLLKGFAFGSRHPTVAAVVAGQALSGDQISAIEALLREAQPRLEAAPEIQAATTDPQDGIGSSVEWLLTAMLRLQRATDIAVYERGKLITAGLDQASFYVPTTEAALLPLNQVLHAVVELMQFQSQHHDTRPDLGRLTDALGELTKASLTGLNIPKFVRAAEEMGIPFQVLPGQVYQYGYGRRGRWFESTFTDNTPHISAKIGRLKHVAAPMLRLAGIPVPDHAIAPTAEVAVKLAEQLGYPVVVKPADQDGNTGVAAGLQSAEEVTAAFHAARRHSNLILVEKHFAGSDYRVIVFHGDVVWAHQRVPAGVTGDGRHTVKELLDELNADPRRGKNLHAMVRTLEFNDEAAALLKQAGLETDTVPADGQFVKLRRASNQRNGGVIAPALDRMHPDNRRLAVRAAQALRLDIAGVDMLIPDIGVSWHESGAAINEVNTQPGTRQVSVDLMALILRRLVPGNGRIPVVVVLGADPGLQMVSALEVLIARNRAVPGCHDAGSVRVNGQVILPGTQDPYMAGRALCLDRAVDALVLSINDDSILRTGLPFPRFDILVLAGSHVVPRNKDAATAPIEPVIRDILTVVLPACDGTILTIDQSPLRLDGFEKYTQAQWRNLPSHPKDVLAALMDEIRAADARHLATAQPQPVVTALPELATA